MKLATARVGDHVVVGCVTSKGLIRSRHATMIDLITSADVGLVDDDPVSDFCTLAPLTRPGKILGSGVNYASHKDENPDAVMPDVPGFFSKLPSSVIGDGDDIVIPYAGAHVDYEVELAVVMGRGARNVSVERALDHVFGYTVCNDVSERRIQFTPNQMDIGKGCDTFCPLGPVIVTADEVSNPQDLELRSYVNGELRQSASTKTMIFTVAELVSAASTYITLEPGDVISTGTPAGCGTFRRPSLWLQPGDDVVVEAVGIGRLHNMVAGPPS